LASQGDAAVRQLVEPKSARMSPIEEADRLLSAVMPFAEKMLSKHEEFFPFGGAIRSDGSIVSFGIYDRRGSPPAASVMKDLLTSLRNDARHGLIDASALVHHTSLTDPQIKPKDAVVVSLDHRGGFSANLVFPYVVQSGVVRFGDSIRQVNEDIVFFPPLT